MRVITEKANLRADQSNLLLMIAKIYRFEDASATEQYLTEHPEMQQLIDSIDQANNLTELKAVLVD